MASALEFRLAVHSGSKPRVCEVDATRGRPHRRSQQAAATASTARWHTSTGVGTLADMTESLGENCR